MNRQDLTVAQPQAPASASNPVLVYLRSLESPESRRAMATALQMIVNRASNTSTRVEDVDWRSVDYARAAGIRSILAEAVSNGEIAPSYANLSLVALRNVIKVAQRLGLISGEQRQGVMDATKAIKAHRIAKGRRVTPAEIAKLMESCNAENDALGSRDSALLCVLFSAGLRRSEIGYLDLEDLTLEPPTLMVRMGKGKKDRRAPLHPSAIPILERWLEYRGRAPGAFLTKIDAWGRATGTPLDGDAIGRVLKERIKRAKVAPFSPHDCRRTYITQLLESGVDVLTVSKCAGHEQIETTKKYDMRAEDTKEAAVREHGISFDI